MPPVVDLIIRIKNGYMSGRDVIESPLSKFRRAVLDKLQALGYIESYEVSGEGVAKDARIVLNYSGRSPAVTDVKIFSKPGRRVYVTVNDLKPVLGGYGYAIISTSRGILTNVEAKKEGIAGELLFHIW